MHEMRFIREQYEDDSADVNEEGSEQTNFDNNNIRNFRISDRFTFGV